MKNFVCLPRRILFCGALAAATLFLAGVAGWAWPHPTKPRQEAANANDDASLLEGFRHVEAASVSDALEQISGRKMYMSHRMRPIFPTKFAGLALTVLLKKESNHDPDALKGMLAAIDQGSGPAHGVVSPSGAPSRRSREKTTRPPARRQTPATEN